ncbi:unnamed protein product [Adineta ricciae]|uniref:F-box domain-containing protein n=1 Tax=Adineta ricciae TaxID=249248 RepID=A0A814SIB7_ADIRI|nr:unnamed protein product [Adineta ricciae]CAF1148522.1 unnamed protein product [Adineta ricciae]
MSLELIPDEILLLIFSYLHQFDIIYAFSKLNQRFRRVIDPHLQDIDLSQDRVVTYPLFRLWCKHILPSHCRKVRTLRLAGYHQLQLFSRHIRHLTNLQVLEITDIEEDKFRNKHDDDLHHVLDISFFLDEALTLPCLHTLSIDLTANNVLKTISSSSARHNLTHLSLISPRPNGLSCSVGYISQMDNIQYFSANFDSVNDLRIVLTRLPNLRELKAAIVNFDDPEVATRIKVPGTLETLWLEFGCFHCCTNFKSLKLLLDVFKTQIHSLTLISVNVDEDLSQYRKFHKLVADFTCLKTFRYHIRTLHHSDSLKRCTHIQEEPDGSYLFYTFPPPRRFDIGSEATRGGRYIDDSLTSSELFSCNRLWTLGEKVPSTFKLTNNVTLAHVQKIEIGAIFGNDRNTLCEYLSQVISLSPNLKWLDMDAGKNTKVFIDGIRKLFRNGVNKGITRLDLSLDWNKNTQDHHPNFWNELAETVPRLKTLKLNIKYTRRCEDYSLMTEIINDSKRSFCKLTRLLLGFYSRLSTLGMLEYCQKYIDEMQKPHYNSFSFTLDYDTEQGHCVHVWL